MRDEIKARLALKGRSSWVAMGETHGIEKKPMDVLTLTGSSSQGR